MATGPIKPEDDPARFTDDAKERLRFEMELEFVECLANPKYLNHLAQTLMLEDKRLLAYLDYLQYWKTPKYAKFITYPHCLYMLDMLRDEDFRKKLKDPQVAETIHVQQFYHWQYLNAKKEAEASSNPPS